MTRPGSLVQERKKTREAADARSAVMTRPFEHESWCTSTPENLSPHELDRDRMIERLLDRDGRPLSLILVYARFDPERVRWAAQVHHRIDYLAYLDRLGREAEPASDRELCRAMAAWIRGLPHGVCPEIFDWADGRSQRATIERDRS